MTINNDASAFALFGRVCSPASVLLYSKSSRLSISDLVIEALRYPFAYCATIFANNCYGVVIARERAGQGLGEFKGMNRSLTTRYEVGE